MKSKLEIYNDFNHLQVIKKAMSYDEFETEIEKHSKLTTAEFYNCLHKGIDPEALSQQKLDNYIKNLSATRKRQRDYTINKGDVLSKAPSFNKAYIENPTEFEKTYTNVLFTKTPSPQQFKRINQGSARMNWTYKRPYSASKELSPARQILKNIENAGQVAKNIIIIMDKPQAFTSLDLLVDFHRMITKLKKYKRNILILNKDLSFSTPKQAFYSAPSMKLENPKLVSQMHHYITSQTEVHLKAGNMPSKSQFGGYIPHYTGKQIVTDAESTSSGHKIVATRDAEKRDYKLYVTHNEKSCDCRYCPKSRDCQFVNIQQKTDLVHRNYHKEAFIKMNEYIEMVEHQQEQFINAIDRAELPESEFSYKDKIDILSYFGMYTFVASDIDVNRKEFEESDDRLVNERMFTELSQVKHIDLLDYESLARYDMNNFTYEIFDFGTRRYHKLLTKFLGEEQALQAHQRLNEYKEEHNRTEYYGDVGLMTATI